MQIFIVISEVTICVFLIVEEHFYNRED